MNHNVTDTLSNLDTLIPPAMRSNPETASREVVRAVMIRANQEVGIRHALGWRGVQELVSPDPACLALTARIQQRAGVYGLISTSTESVDSADFDLLYFPDADEPLMEEYSVSAGLLATADDYLDRVRAFAMQPDFYRPFVIGRIQTRLAGKGLYLALTAVERLGWNAPDGIALSFADGLHTVLAPGDCDQDLAAWRLSQSFFDVLAASLSHTLATSPATFYTHHRDWYGPAAHWLSSCERRLTLGYFTSDPAGDDFDWDRPPQQCWQAPAARPAAFEPAPWWQPEVTAECDLRKEPAQRHKPRFILLTGFLGSGKTTFLDHFLQAQTAQHRFVAVVQNEIGEKGLDASLLSEKLAVVEMDEGCVCCSLAGNLRSALTGINERFDPDFVVLETTGLANPANMLAEIGDLADLIQFGSVTTLVDGLSGREALERFAVARDQVRLADVILINKTDCAQARDLEGLEARIRQLNPVAELHRVSHGRINPALLYGVNYTKTPQRPLFQQPDLAHCTHEDEQIQTRSIHLSEPLDKTRLLAALRSGGSDLLRAKGVAHLADEADPVLIQYAPGTLEITPLEQPPDEEDFLVFIGRHLDGVVEMATAA